jgi:hypothetical protein
MASSRTSPPDSPDVAASARLHTSAALQALVDALSIPHERVNAATALLALAYGAPKLTVEYKNAGPATAYSNGKSTDAPAWPTVRQTR